MNSEELEEFMINEAELFWMKDIYLEMVEKDMKDLI